MSKRVTKQQLLQENADLAQQAEEDIKTIISLEKDLEFEKAMNAAHTVARKHQFDTLIVVPGWAIRFFRWWASR